MRRRCAASIAWASVAAAAFAAGVVPATAQENPAQEKQAQDKDETKRVRWLTGAALRRRLDRPVSVSWSNVPLRRAVTRLSKSQATAVFLDRRIDPGRRLNGSPANMPLEAVWKQIAAHARAEISSFGPVTYIGPGPVAARLRTLAALRLDDVRKLPEAAQPRWLGQRALRWDDLNTPRDLLAQLAAEADARLVGTEQVPHDLWAAADLPAMSLIDRLTLVAAEMTLTFSIEDAGREIRLVPMPERVVIIRSYDFGTQPERVRRTLAKILPEEDLKVSGGKLFVRGRVEDHELVAAAKSGRKTTTSRRGSGKTLVSEFTATDQPISAVVELVAKKLDFVVAYDEAAIKAAGISIEQRVTLNVKQVTLEDLLDEILNPAGLTHRRSGRRLVIRPIVK
jgi:hypothetical protein